MAKTFLTPVDMSGLEVLNARVHNLGSAPAALAGRAYYNTVDGILYWYDAVAAAWKSAGGMTQADADARYVNETDHTKAQHDALGIDASTVGGNSAATLLARANHTGTQAISTVSNLQAALDAKEATANKGAANGYASLDGGGKVPGSQLPALAITETHVVASITERDALVVQEGDVAVVTGGSSYIWDGVAWIELTAPGENIIAGDGLTRSGDTLNVVGGGGITVGADSVAVAWGNAVALDGTTANGTTASAARADHKHALPANVPRKVGVAVGNGTATAITVTHNLGTRDVTVGIYAAAAPYAEAEVDVEHTDLNTVTLRFAAAPALNAYRAVVVG